MIKRLLLLFAGVVALAAVGGSMIHPFDPSGHPAKNNTLLPGAQIHRETLFLLQQACSNCHSQQTVWPWYGHLAPASWLLERDVQQARMHMNLSQWDEYTAGDRMRLLSEIGSAVRNHQMPPERYLWLHPEARLSDVELQQIYAWTRAERSRLGMDAIPSSSPPVTGASE